METTSQINENVYHKYQGMAIGFLVKLHFFRYYYTFYHNRSVIYTHVYIIYILAL